MAVLADRECMSQLVHKAFFVYSFTTNLEMMQRAIVLVR